MGKLQGLRVYECGAMDRVKDGGIGWRNKITPILRDEYGLIILDPTNKPISQGQETPEFRNLINSLKLEGQYDKVTELMKPIRKIDLRMVDICDIIIANLDLNIHPCGSYEEIFWGNRMKKPIFIHCEQGKQNIPNWLFAALPHDYMFSDWNGLFNMLDNIDDGIYEDQRWAFFTL